MNVRRVFGFHSERVYSYHMHDNFFFSPSHDIVNDSINNSLPQIILKYFYDYESGGRLVTLHLRADNFARLELVPPAAVIAGIVIGYCFPKNNFPQ